MSAKRLPNPNILDLFRVSNPRFVTETALATIWQVYRHGGQPAALKIYHGTTMRNEEAGFDLLEAWEGRGVVKLFGRTANAALVEWLSGPSLGDLTRSDQDETANGILVKVATNIHAKRVQAPKSLPRLADWFEDLFVLKMGPSCPAATRRDIASCQLMARRLLATQQTVVPLHGDLHHDNIRLGDRGYCAFDAKGVLGERTYELANAFRNPKGAQAAVRNSHRIRALAERWADGFGVDRRRLVMWATAKCALSIAWRTKDALERDPEFDLLSLLSAIAAEDG